MYRIPLPRSRHRAIPALALAAALAAVPSVAAGAAHAGTHTAPPPTRAADWPVFNHDAARSGGLSDRTLTLANVGGLRRRWVAALSETADSTPILLSHVAMPRGAARALLFQTTKHGTTYAIDARTGATVWTFKTAGPKMYPNSPNDQASKITTSTPVADPSGRYVYVPSTNGLVHKLVAATGAEVTGRGFPLRITLMPDVEKNASALNIANGYLYAATSGYIGDQGPYDGHVVALRLSDGATHVFNTLCGNIDHLLLDKSYDKSSRYACARQRSGMWARAGVVVDPDPSMHGWVYVATGNGAFDANHGGADYGDSIVALRADGARIVDSYTPASYQRLEDTDADLGSTAPVLLPREPRSRTPLMAVQGGKDGIIRLVNRARLGGVGGELQNLPAPDAVLFSQPAMWRQPGGGTWVFVGDGSHVRALRLETSASGVSRLVPAWSDGSAGTSPVVVNGIVFTAGGALEARDATNGRLLWTSVSRSAGGNIGGIHWESPVVVNGYAYISDETGHLAAYALPGR